MRRDRILWLFYNINISPETSNVHINVIFVWNIKKRGNDTVHTPSKSNIQQRLDVSLTDSFACTVCPDDIEMHV